MSVNSENFEKLLKKKNVLYSTFTEFVYQLGFYNDLLAAWDKLSMAERIALGAKYNDKRLLAVLNKEKTNDNK